MATLTEDTTRTKEINLQCQKKKKSRCRRTNMCRRKTKAKLITVKQHKCHDINHVHSGQTWNISLLTYAPL